jgi:capsular polysaccharide biosynthesis protein
MNSEAPSPHSDEIDLQDLIQPLWAAKWRLLLWGLVFVLITGIYQLGGVALNKDDSGRAQMQVHFNFEGAASGLFPNQTQFSPLELLADPVLSAVYQRHFDDTATFTEFTQALTLTPSFAGAGALNTVVEKLTEQDKGLSVAEFNDAVAAYSKNLNTQSKTKSTLTLELDLVHGDLAKATAILTDIADTWATQALTVRGVHQLNKPPINSQTLTSNDKELLIQVNILSDTHQLLTKAVDTYVDDRELNGIADPKSGLRLSDLSHLLNTEGKYKIAILKEMVIKSGAGSDNAFWYQGFREARLGKLERERDALKRMVTVYNDAMTQFSQQQDPQSQVSTMQTPASPQVYSPQYGNDLVNTLLDLGSKMSDPEYRKELLEAKIKLSAQLQAVITEIEFYQPSTQQSQNTLNPEKISQLISQSNTQVSRLNDALIGITKVGNARYLTGKGQLYDLEGAVTFVSTSNLTPRLMLKLTLAFIMGCAIGVVNIFARRLLAPQLATAALAQ